MKTELKQIYDQLYHDKVPTIQRIRKNTNILTILTSKSEPLLEKSISKEYGEHNSKRPSSASSDREGIVLAIVKYFLSCCIGREGSSRKALDLRNKVQDESKAKLDEERKQLHSLLKNFEK